MRKIYTFTICFAFLLFSFPLLGWSYSWLYVYNPHTWASSGQGTIDEAVITIEPKGIYAEYNVYLTFSAMGLNMTPNDTLEISYYFSLPKNSILHDSWLWVNDTARAARHIDRWTAWTVYNNIVGYRRDPSVLCKDWQDNYQLRIYPLMGTGQRKVKISFMAPSDWTSRIVSYPVPMDLLKPSLIPTGSIRVLVKSDAQWMNPRFSGYPDLHFKPSSEPDYPGFLETSLPASFVQNQVNLSYASPMKNGIYLNRFSSETDEGYYQLAFLPSEVFKISNKRKMLALFDFESANNYQTDGRTVYNSFRSTLFNNLTESDEFNIFLATDGQPVKASETWIPADSSNLMEIFSALGNEPVQDASNLESLLKSAIQFIHSNGNDGEIILFSNSNEFWETDKANELMSKLNQLGTLPRITIVDFYELWTNWYFVGGRYFNGNEYFYTLLSRQSSGNYYKYNYWEGSVNDKIDVAIAGMSNYLGSFDLHTRLQSGFCYGRYDLNEQAQSVNLGKPILQIGKYKGTGDLIVEAAAEYKGEAIYSSSSFSETKSADSLLKKAWAGRYIASLEDDWNWDNQHVQDIISSSLKNRVLSTYTAFLALEPGLEYLLDDPGSASGTTTTGSVGAETLLSGNGSAKTDVMLMGTTQVAAMDIPYKVFPNPFYNRLHVQLAIPSSINWHTVIVEIFNATGQKVRIFNLGELIYNGFLNIEWDGRNNAGTSLGAGIYYMVIRNDQFKKDIKLVKLQ